MKLTPIELVILERGLGLDFDGLLISYHKDYASYVELNELLKRGGGEFLRMDDVKSFPISLQDEVRFSPLTYSIVAQNMSLSRKTTKKKQATNE